MHALPLLVLLIVANLLSGCTNPVLHVATPLVSPPSFSPGGGVFGTDQSVTLSTAAGTTIYYTTDGSTPTTSSTKYTSPIVVAGNGTTESIEAIAVEGGNSSAVAAANFIINYSIGGTSTLASPTFGPSSGTVPNNQLLTLSYPAGASVYYTTNGSTPSASNGTLYNPASGITLSGANGTDITIRALSVESGIIPSPVVSASFVVSYSADTVVPAISISDSTGQVSASGINLTWATSPPSVIFNGGTSATTFYYVVSYDDQNPAPPSTSSSTVTGSPATVALSPPDSGFHSVTIEAFAVDPSTTSGPTQKTTYYLNEAVATPTASAGSGRYASDAAITFNDATSGASVSVSGTSTDYLSGGSAWTGGPISLGPSMSVTLNAIGPVGGYVVTATASLTGWLSSTMSTTYYIVYPKLTFTGSETLTIPNIPASYPGGSIQSINAKLWGAGGAAGEVSGGNGGGGGFAEQSISVSDGQVYSITVGAAGQLVDACSVYYPTSGKGGNMTTISSSAGYLAIAGGGGGGGLNTSLGSGGGGGQSGSQPGGATGGASGFDGTGTAAVAGGSGGAAGTGAYNGTVGGATGGGQGGGYTWAGWGGQGYGGGGGGGATNGGLGAGAGGGGNYGDIIVDGNGRSPGNSGDPDLASGYGYGGVSTNCGGNGQGGYAVVYVN